MNRPIRIQLEVSAQSAQQLDELSHRLNFAYILLLEQATALRARGHVLREGLPRLRSRWRAALARGLVRLALWYEQLVEWAKDHAERCWRVVFSPYGLRDLVDELKYQPRYQDLQLVYSTVLHAAAFRLTQSCRAWLDGVTGRRDDRPGWPQFRSWNTSWFSLLWQGKQGWKLANALVEYERRVKRKKARRAKNRVGRHWRWRLTLSLGASQLPTPERKRPPQRTTEVLLSEPPPRSVRKLSAKSVRITKDGGRWYVVIMYDRPVTEPKAIERVIAIDPHHVNLFVAVDNQGRSTVLPTPRFVGRLDRLVDALKSRRDRHDRRAGQIPRPDGSIWTLPSGEWTRLDRRAKEEGGRRERRKESWVNSIANWLCCHYDAIVVGSYAPHGDEIPAYLDRRRLFNQSLLGRLRLAISSIASRSGKTYVELAEEDTSRTCHDCGWMMPTAIPPGVQAWTCGGCGREHARHENAARNLLRLGIQHLNAEGLAWLPIPQVVPVHTARTLDFDGRQVTVQ